MVYEDVRSLVFNTDLIARKRAVAEEGFKFLYERKNTRSCSADKYIRYDRNHMSYGTPYPEIDTECACLELCDANATCRGIDFNFDNPPYQNSHCWLHFQDKSLVLPFMTV